MPGVRDVCTSLLHALGYQASGAEGRDQALATLSGDGAEVALALVDMELPGAQDGSLLRALRREQPGLRVLLMSGPPAQQPSALPPNRRRRCARKALSFG